jgi:hypothetical protein
MVMVMYIAGFLLFIVYAGLQTTAPNFAGQQHGVLRGQQHERGSVDGPPLHLRSRSAMVLGASRRARSPHEIRVHQLFDHAFTVGHRPSEDIAASRSQIDSVARSPHGIVQISWSERTASFMALVADPAQPVDASLVRGELKRVLLSPPFEALLQDFEELMAALFDPAAQQRSGGRAATIAWLRGLASVRRQGGSAAAKARALLACRCVSVGEERLRGLVLDFLPPLQEGAGPRIVAEAVRAACFERVGVRLLQAAARAAHREDDAELEARRASLAAAGLLPSDLGVPAQFWLLAAPPADAAERERMCADGALPYHEAVRLAASVGEQSDPYEKLRVLCDACAECAFCVERHHAAPPSARSPPLDPPPPRLAELGQLLERIEHRVRERIEQRKQQLLRLDGPSPGTRAALPHLAVLAEIWDRHDLEVGAPPEPEPAAAAPPQAPGRLALAGAEPGGDCNLALGAEQLLPLMAYVLVRRQLELRLSLGRSPRRSAPGACAHPVPPLGGVAHRDGRRRRPASDARAAGIRPRNRHRRRVAHPRPGPAAVARALAYGCRRGLTGCGGRPRRRHSDSRARAQQPAALALDGQRSHGGSCAVVARPPPTRPGRPPEPGRSGHGQAIAAPRKVPTNA